MEYGTGRLNRTQNEKKGFKMTKQEAIQAMKEGKKVTHTLFSPNEWMTMEGDQIVLEDGVKCDPSLEFWFWRTVDLWNDGYSLYETACVNHIWKAYPMPEGVKCVKCGKPYEKQNDC